MQLFSLASVSLTNLRLDFFSPPSPHTSLSVSYYLKKTNVHLTQERLIQYLNTQLSNLCKSPLHSDSVRITEKNEVKSMLFNILGLSIFLPVVNVNAYITICQHMLTSLALKRRLCFHRTSKMPLFKTGNNG